MEYIDGEDLGSLLRRIGRLPGDKASEIARKICAGLAAAHSKGVLHRDLKPANVMLDGRGEILIMDFGLAGLAHEIQDLRSGTPAYMSPEQLAGRRSHRTQRYLLAGTGALRGIHRQARIRWPHSGRNCSPPERYPSNSSKFSGQGTRSHGRTNHLALSGNRSGKSSRVCADGCGGFTGWRSIGRGARRR